MDLSYTKIAILRSCLNIGSQALLARFGCKTGSNPLAIHCSDSFLEICRICNNLVLSKKRNLLAMKSFVAVIALMLFGITLLNSQGPIFGSRKQLASFAIGPLHVRLGYIK